MADLRFSGVSSTTTYYEVYVRYRDLEDADYYNEEHWRWLESTETYEEALRNVTAYQEWMQSPRSFFIQEVTETIHLHPKQEIVQEAKDAT